MGRRAGLFFYNFDGFIIHRCISGSQSGALTAALGPAQFSRIFLPFMVTFLLALTVMSLLALTLIPPVPLMVMSLPLMVMVPSFFMLMLALPVVMVISSPASMVRVLPTDRL